MALYELLIRGDLKGSLSGSHAIDYVGGLPGNPRAITSSDWPAIVGQIDSLLASRIAELETEVENLQLGPKPSGNPIRGVSKLTIMRRLGDKWPTLKATLSSLPEIAQDSWILAQEISIKDELFISYRDQIQTILDLTDEDLIQLLTP